MELVGLFILKKEIEPSAFQVPDVSDSNFRIEVALMESLIKNTIEKKIHFSLASIKCLSSDWVQCRCIVQISEKGDACCFCKSHSEGL